jgi:hypothetical protein
VQTIKPKWKEPLFQVCLLDCENAVFNQSTLHVLHYIWEQLITLVFVKRATCFTFVSWIVKMLYLIRVYFMFFIIFENSWSPLYLWYGTLRHQLMWANLSQRCMFGTFYLMSWMMLRNWRCTWSSFPLLKGRTLYQWMGKGCRKELCCPVHWCEPPSRDVWIHQLSVEFYVAFHLASVAVTSLQPSSKASYVLFLRGFFYDVKWSMDARFMKV